MRRICTEPRSFEIADFWEEAENIRTFVFRGTLGAKPGQFALLWLPGVDEKPFSIARDYDGEIWLTICKVGPFTEKLFALKKGQKIGLRGAFGHGFSAQSKKHVVLVGGGYGTAPLHFAGQKHLENGSKITMIIGARSKNLIIHKDWAEKSGMKVLITTNDGSAGQKGFTTDGLAGVLASEKVDHLQTCGPEKMMRAIAEMAVKNGISCEVSIERFMKCGFGVCGQCVTESGEKMCETGPVVDGKKALGYADFGVFHRGAEGQKIFWP